MADERHLNFRVRNGGEINGWEIIFELGLESLAGFETRIAWIKILPIESLDSHESEFDGFATSLPHTWKKLFI